jgi:hypothetical protein
VKRIALLGVAVLVASAAACDRSPTAPAYGSRGSHLQFGRAINGLLSGPDTARFYLDATAGDLIAAYAASPDSTVVVLFTDSGNGLGDAFPTNRGTTPGTTAAFTYLVPHTGALAITMFRPEHEPGQVEFALQMDTVYIGPEHLKPAITLGQVISGESIDSIGDIDVFTFNGTAGKQIYGYLAAKGTTAGSVTMQIYATNPDSILESVTSPSGDSILELHTTNGFTLGSTGTYHVRMQVTDGSSYVGPYQFEIYPVDSAPESISATVTPGDTVQGESIDHVGDVDVFTVNGKAGTSYNLFAQTLGTSQRNLEKFDALDANGNIIASIQASPGPNLTDGAGSGVFTAPANGQFSLRVQNLAGSRGPYRFFVYPINTAPEIAPATFTLGDSITTETIGLPGDVDVFTMNVTKPSYASVCAVSGSPSVAVAGVSTISQGTCTVGFQVQPGSYQVTVADPPRSSFRGPYHLWSWAFFAGPEHVSPVITLGDTVKGESIDAPGDFDVFTLTVGPHTLVNVGMSGPSSVQPTWRLFKNSGDMALSIGGVGQSSRVSLDSAFTYHVDVQGNAPGPYSFVITPWPTAPEHHAATVALGSSITDEQVDFPNDVDQFTLTAPPGTIGIFGINNLTPPTIDVQILSPDSSTVLAELENGPVVAPTYSQRFTVPSTGTVLMRVLGGGQTGPYSIGTAIINPLPEHVPSTTAIGDTVTGESIDYIGDLDQFTFSGTAGQNINVYLQTPGGNTDIILQVLGPDGTVLGQVQSFYAAPLANQSTGTMTLPTTGTYTISVSGSGLVCCGNGTYATGPYVFAILPSS